MLEVLERMKINKPSLVKALLVVFSERLETAENELPSLDHYSEVKEVILAQTHVGD